jgi:signal peptidase
MDTVREMIQSLRTMKKRQFFGQIVSLGLIVTSALMIWKFLMVVSNSESPVVVVLSGSMEPAFRRGDILFLWMQSEHFAVGDIVVFKIDQREIPIVHRVHRVYVVCDDS